MKNIQQALKQAQELQNRVVEKQKEFDSKTVEQQAGGGLVTVSMTYNGEVKKLTIDPSICKPEEKEMLEDLIVAALNNTKNSADERKNEEMKEITGSLGLPSGFNLPF